MERGSVVSRQAPIDEPPAERCSRNKPVTLTLLWHLTNTYPFNPDPADVESLSDEEYRAKYGEEAFEELIASRIEAQRKMNKALAEERQFPEEDAELVGTL